MKRQKISTQFVITHTISTVVRVVISQKIKFMCNYNGIFNTSFIIEKLHVRVEFDGFFFKILIGLASNEISIQFIWWAGALVYFEYRFLIKYLLLTSLISQNVRLQWTTNARVVWLFYVLLIFAHWMTWCASGTHSDLRSLIYSLVSIQSVQNMAYFIYAFVIYRKR